ncbi:MAG: acetyltransferase [Deltaproteobacteria bacterium]|nr:acetyltransferase [Deltaproteobacteria bacterium]
MDKSVIVVGAGGHAKVVISTLREAGYTVPAAYDDDEAKWGKDVLGVPILGPIRCLETATNNLRAVIAVGENLLRKTISKRLFLNWVSVIHPKAYVHESANLGAGTVVFAGAVIQPEADIGEHVIVNTGATIDHDCRIGSYAHLGPGAHLSGGVEIGEGVLLGISSAVLPGMRVGQWSVVGGGGVVIRNVPSNVKVAGVPAEETKSTL